MARTRLTGGTAYVVQRARGVYLARVSEHEHGTEESDAFATAAAARAWCENFHDQGPLIWAGTPGTNSSWPMWAAVAAD